MLSPYIPIYKISKYTSILCSICRNIICCLVVHPRSLTEGWDTPVITGHCPYSFRFLGNLDVFPRIGSVVYKSCITHSSSYILSGGYSMNLTGPPQELTGGNGPRYGRRRWRRWGGDGGVCGECERRAHGRRAQGARSHLWVGIYMSSVKNSFMAVLLSLVRW